jgi:hypothetical protein
VKKSSLIFLFIFLSYSIHGAQVESFCFSRPLLFECFDQENGNFSLEGEFSQNHKFYFISARRAYGEDWCKDALRKIQQAMSAEKFCLDAEVIDIGDIDLTIEKVYSKKARWSYFLEN